MRLILTLFSLVVVLSIFSQNNYYFGYKEGFKYGCQCIDIPPKNAALTSGSYDKGYLDGKVDGLLYIRNNNVNNSSQPNNKEPYEYNQDLQTPDFELIERILREKQRRYNEQQRISVQSQQSESENERRNAINNMNLVIDYYNSVSYKPETVKNGWHEVFAMNSVGFCEIRKVYVLNNKITQYCVNDKIYREVTYSLPIVKAKTAIKLSINEDILLQIIFVKYLNNQTSNCSSPPEAGKVSFWKSFKGGGYIEIFIEGVSIGEIKYYFDAETPTCDQHGTVTFEAIPGTYNYVARNSGAEWSGNVTINRKGCKRIKLIK
jgi:hypothetical protein